MMNSIVKEFQKLCEYFGVEFISSKLENAIKLASKKAVEIKTPHDTQVINLSSRYEIDREYFTKNHSKLIANVVFKQHRLLKQTFS